MRLELLQGGDRRKPNLLKEAPLSGPSGRGRSPVPLLFGGNVGGPTLGALSIYLSEETKVNQKATRVQRESAPAADAKKVGSDLVREAREPL